ncbi:gb [Venturia nashicola]|uniref:Gb n=1 Tax=Venturia nashicola TaxID=86259 RepID=A0A4Z1NKI1_9PEZI|nr:gb [Venturia nashicola]
MVKSFSVMIELSRATRTPTPGSLETNHLGSFLQKPLLPVIPAVEYSEPLKRDPSLEPSSEVTELEPEGMESTPEVAAPEEEAEKSETSSQVQVAASTHPLSQNEFDAWLEHTIPKDQHDAARAGWAYALAGGAHKSLNEQFNGQKAETGAAIKGWKQHHIEVAKSQGLEVFYCEKAPECTLDQYLRKDSRPCVSNYFGRNKRNTARISSMITWCRKHYQRSGYHGRKNPANNLEWPREKAGLILEQLRRNEDDYQRSTGGESLTYTVCLKASEYKRMCDYNNGKPVIPPKLNAKSFEAPMDILLHIHANWVGENKTYNECVALTQWAEGKLDKNICADLPLWEMVPDFPDGDKESGDEEEEEDEDMDDIDDDEDKDNAGPVTPRKRASPQKATTKKSTRCKSSPKKNASPRSALATRALSAKKGRLSGQGSIQKPE